MKFVGLLLALCAAPLAVAQQGTRMVYLVRHAESATPAPDALLNAAGDKRAACLANMLKEAGIKQIYVTDDKRTQQTSAHLAAALKLTPTIVPAKDPNTLIKDVMYSGGGNILVVSDKETLPFIVARLKAGTIAPIGDNEYDRLLVTTIIEGGATQASTLRYCTAEGKPSAPPAKTPSTPSGKKTTAPKKP